LNIQAAKNLKRFPTTMRKGVDACVVEDFHLKALRVLVRADDSDV